ncbi:ATP-binding cassette domain-containing protein [Bacillus sp. ISL-4]|nr:ATP-binding cassette domain-containing protein [Bacillus sp. ISL-4]MBT2673642.1 ATP-binding cassette domain-containing protein [Streptomyces sp. ISL-14]
MHGARFFCRIPLSCRYLFYNFLNSLITNIIVSGYKLFSQYIFLKINLLGGVKLSGGQNQRVSIARIFLKNPPILILDKATSALDTETEKAVQKASERLSINRKTLVIAHRLATIKHADRITVVQNGEIIEQGAHNNLLHQDGAYKNLILAQTV